MEKALRKDYGAKPNIFFRDADGDVVTIKSSHDLKYAFNSVKDQNASNVSIKIAALKLFAEISPGSPMVSAKKPKVAFKTVSIIESAETTVKIVDPSYRDYDSINRDSKQSYEEDSIADLEGKMQKQMQIGQRGSNGSDSPERDLSSARAAAASAAARAAPFEVLWKKGELLGSGSFGKVYSGINLSNGERIAVKEVQLLRRGSKGKRHRQQAQARALQQEVRILGSLDHPNIIKYLGTEYTKHTLRIFLELANDGTVKDAINEFGASKFN